VDRGALPAYTQAGDGAGATLTADAAGEFPEVHSVAAVLGARYLVCDLDAFAAHADHGVYVLTDAGDEETPWVLTRAEAHEGGEAASAGDYLVIGAGDDTFGGRVFMVLTTGAITVDTTAVAWGALAGVTTHDQLNGLLDDDHTQYALLEGRGAGQTLV